MVVLPLKFIVEAPAFNVAPVLVVMFHPVTCDKVTVEPFRFIVLVFELLEEKTPAVIA